MLFLHVNIKSNLARETSIVGGEKVAIWKNCLKALDMPRFPNNMQLFKIES